MNKEYKYILLNVPARQSRNYYDYLKANIPTEYLVFVDALFGGLDVAARLKGSSESESDFMENQIHELISKKDLTQEGVILELSPFIDDFKDGTEENFIIVLIRTHQNMNDPVHQKALSSFLERNKILTYTRFAAIINAATPIANMPIPQVINKQVELYSNGQVTLLEFSLESLDAPRDIVMRKLQNFSDIASSRTFFAVNFAKEEKIIHKSNNKYLKIIEDWSRHLLYLRKIFGK